jgi:hypothetical protein
MKDKIMELRTKSLTTALSIEEITELAELIAQDNAQIEAEDVSGNAIQKNSVNSSDRSQRPCFGFFGHRLIVAMTRQII